MYFISHDQLIHIGIASFTLGRYLGLLAISMLIRVRILIVLEKYLLEDRKLTLGQERVRIDVYFCFTHMEKIINTDILGKANSNLVILTQT